MAIGKYAEWLTDDGLNRIRGWARNGLTDEQIAHNMHITRSTLYDWKNKHQAISDALKETKEICDNNVENALYKAALEGNTTAMIFWLKNRRPDTWREKPIPISLVKEDDDPLSAALRTLGENDESTE